MCQPDEFIHQVSQPTPCIIVCSLYIWALVMLQYAIGKEKSRYGYVIAEVHL